jgi:hypothetical protein
MGVRDFPPSLEGGRRSAFDCKDIQNGVHSSLLLFYCLFRSNSSRSCKMVLIHNRPGSSKV